MSTPILVTGATGNTGASLVEALVKAGETVRAGVHSMEKGRSLKGDNVELAEIDILNAASLAAAMDGVEKLYLLPPFVPNMVELSGALVDAAKKAGIKHIVKLSGAGAGEDAITLGRWHWQGEKQVEESGIPHTFVRAVSFMQNYSNNQAPSIKAQNAFYDPVGDAKVVYVDARDVADVAAVALTQAGHENKAYTVTGPAAISNRDIAGILSKVTGRTINYVEVTEEAARESLLGVGTPPVIVDALLELLGILKAGYVGEVSPDFERLTGKKGRTFEQFAQDYAAAFK